MTIQLIHGDSRSVLHTLESESVHCCVTSPPYYGLRDYGFEGQIGLESSPDEYLEALSDVFREVHRVLRPDGTLFINIDDCYSKSGRNPNGNTFGGSHASYGERGGYGTSRWPRGKRSGGRFSKVKPLDLIGLPWVLAMNVLRDELGFYWRAVNIWYKPNPQPESVKSRSTRTHEYVFMFSKSERYYYDYEAVAEPVTGTAHSRGDGLHRKARLDPTKAHRVKQNASYSAAVNGLVEKRNLRSVWTIQPASFPEAHFAVYPTELAERCILAGSPAGGTVLDPFNGAGTTGECCQRHRRHYIGIEGSSEYLEITRRRLAQGHLFEAEEPPAWPEINQTQGRLFPVDEEAIT